MYNEKIRGEIRRVLIETSVEELFALWKELQKTSDSGEKGERDYMMDLWRDHSIASLGLRTGLVTKEGVADLFGQLRDSELAPGILCQVFPYWYLLARDFPDSVDRDEILASWLRDLERLTDVSSRLYFWHDYIMLVKPVDAPKISAKLEMEALAYFPPIDKINTLDSESNNFIDASHMVRTAREQGIKLTGLDEYLLGLIENGDTSKMDSSIIRALLIHAVRSDKPKSWKYEMGQKVLRECKDRRGGIGERDSVYEDLTDYFADLGDVETARDIFFKIEEDVILDSALRSFVIYSLEREGPEVISYDEFYSKLKYKKHASEDWRNMWFVQALFMADSGGGVYFDRPEVLAAMVNGDVDLWLPSLTGTLAKPEIAARSEKMIAAYRDHLKELVENLRSDESDRNTERVIETLIKAKLNGLL